MTAGGTTDVHTHPIPPFLREALLAAGRSPSLSGFPDWSPELGPALHGRTRHRQVDPVRVHAGGCTSARTLRPEPSLGDSEFCAGLGGCHPGRFGAFAALPLPDVEGACREACHALDVMRLEGVGLLASYGEHFLGATVFEPLMTELDAREALVFVHPSAHPASRTLGTGYPLWMVEYPVDTTRAAVNLIMTGTTRRFPRIRFILAHNGGTLPFLAWRLSATPLTDTRYAHMDEEGIRAEIAQSPEPEAFGSLLAVTDPTHILFGTDWPYCNTRVVRHLEKALGALNSLDDRTRQAIRHGNAARLAPPRT